MSRELDYTVAYQSDYSPVRQCRMIPDISEVKMYLVVWNLSVCRVSTCHRTVSCFITTIYRDSE